MILLMDVGNTNIKLGLSNGTKNIKTWRMATDTTKTADEFGMTLFDLLNQSGYVFSDIDGIIISSVAPSINYTLEHMCSYYIKVKPIMVSPRINTGLTYKYAINNLGSDRVVNAVAAYNHYGGPVITVDFGTATTFGMVDKDGVFLGGLIAPGIKASTESLVNNAAKLPRIELVKPDTIIGTDTVSNMQAGIIYGFTGLVDYIVKKMKEESGFMDAKVIATGGMSQLVTQTNSKIVDVIDRSLSLKGLKILYDMNK
ncbi:MAG: type III pantothenate kinase [Clostridiales bacterium]|nr:type III pantothenate kinase [Clostridiales bacterium]